MPGRVPIPAALEESGWVKGRTCKEVLLQIVEDSGTVNISYVKERKGTSFYEIEAKTDKELRTAKSLLAISLEHNAQRLKILQQKAAYQSAIRETEREFKQGRRVEFSIIPELLELVLGENGENVLRVKEETGVTRIVIDQEASKIRIFGEDPDKVLQARELLEFKDIRVQVNEDEAQYLISNAGERLNNIKDDSGCVRTAILQEEDEGSDEVQERFRFFVNLTGSVASLGRAKLMIKMHLKCFADIQELQTETAKLGMQVQELDESFGYVGSGDDTGEDRPNGSAKKGSSAENGRRTKSKSDRSDTADKSKSGGGGGGGSSGRRGKDTGRTNATADKASGSPRAKRASDARVASGARAGATAVGVKAVSSAVATRKVNKRAVGADNGNHRNMADGSKPPSSSAPEPSSRNASYTNNGKGRKAKSKTRNNSGGTGASQQAGKGASSSLSSSNTAPGAATTNTATTSSTPSSLPSPISSPPKKGKVQNAGGIDRPEGWAPHALPARQPRTRRPEGERKGAQEQGTGSNRKARTSKRKVRPIGASGIDARSNAKAKASAKANIGADADAKTNVGAGVAMTDSKQKTKVKRSARSSASRKVAEAASASATAVAAAAAAAATATTRVAPKRERGSRTVTKAGDGDAKERKNARGKQDKSEAKTRVKKTNTKAKGPRENHGERQKQPAKAAAGNKHNNAKAQTPANAIRKEGQARATRKDGGSRTAKAKRSAQKRGGEEKVEKGGESKASSTAAESKAAPQSQKAPRSAYRRKKGRGSGSVD